MTTKEKNTNKTRTLNNNNQESIAYYDDKNHDYEEFWVGRDYEHNSEIIALKKLLRNKHFSLAMDYGGGYGRISPAILEHADRLILVDPSIKQLNIAKERLQQYANIDYVRVDKKNCVPAADNSLDLLVMVRVSHHLAEPGDTFKEIARALKPQGLAIIEIANEAHFVNRMKYLKHMKNVPKQSIPIGKRANGIADCTPFYNHNPKTITNLMVENNLQVVDKLSVSNLRNQYLKEHMSIQRMLALEKFFQGKLKVVDFGPSIFFLVKKVE
jgi:SAM-dependent methyltransferase